MKRSRVVASLLVAGLVSSWLPQMVPLEWIDIQPVQWDAPGWSEQRAAPADPIAPLEQAGVAGLHPIRVTNADVGVDLRTVLVPGAYASGDGVRIDDLIHADLAEILREQEQATGERFVPEALATETSGGPGCVAGSTLLSIEDLVERAHIAPPAGGVALTCDVVFTAGEYLAVRSRTVIFEQAVATGWRDETRVHLVDVLQGTRQSAAAMWEESAAEVLWPVVVGMLRQEARGLSTLPITSTPDNDARAQLMERVLEETVFTADGDVLITVPRDFDAPELEGLAISAHADEHSEDRGGRLTLRLDETQLGVGVLLSPLGQQVRAAVSDEAPFAAPFAWAGERQLDCTLVACVALTFDGGPTAFTPGVMDALAAGDAAATFFVRGELGEGFPEAVWRGFAEGHSMQNGTWSGKELATVTDTLDLQTEFTSTRNLVADLIGEVPTMFRPGEGAVDKRVVDTARMPGMMWDLEVAVDESADGQSLDEAVAAVVAEAQAGSIVRIPEDASAAGTTDLIVGLQGRGFQLVTVRQLFGGIVPPPAVYEHAR